ncbi:hypothetical protein ACSBR2_004786 [Camellia fascicularis]
MHREIPGAHIEVGEHDREFTSKDYQDPPLVPLIDAEELRKWSFYRAIIAEFIATLLFLYITVLTVIGYCWKLGRVLDQDLGVHVA